MGNTDKGPTTLESSRLLKFFSRCREADGRSKTRRKRSDRGAEATTTTITGAEARAPEMPAIIATPALRPWHGNDERQPQPKRGVAPSPVRNQDRNRLLVRRSDHAPARGDQDLGPRRDRALRAAKHDLAHALRSALALAAAREDRDQSDLAPRSALAPKSALAPVPRSALALD